MIASWYSGRKLMAKSRKPDDGVSTYKEVKRKTTQTPN